MNENRKDVLLKATYDLLQKCDRSVYVINPMDTSVFYDEANCDGACLMEDIAIEMFLGDWYIPEEQKAIYDTTDDEGQAEFYWATRAAKLEDDLTKTKHDLERTKIAYSDLKCTLMDVEDMARKMETMVCEAL